MSQRPVPEKVEKALDIAVRLEFDYNCLKPVGRLLAVLTAQAGAGTIAELGSGCGVGTAWLASGLSAGQRLITVDADAERSLAVAALFEDVDTVNVLQGDWCTSLIHAPFQLVFVDVPDARDAGCDEVVAALAIGGLAVLDDFKPVFAAAGREDGLSARCRRRWLSHPDLLASEVLTSATTSVIVASRIR